MILNICANLAQMFKIQLLLPWKGGVTTNNHTSLASAALFLIFDKLERGEQ